MYKSLLYAVNTASQIVTAGGTVNFGSAVRKYGCGCTIDSGNPVVRGNGYYEILANISFEGEAGTTVITLMKDGVTIPGATASLTTVADTNYTVTIPAVIRETCPCQSTITAVVSTLGATISNAAIEVAKL